MKYVRTHVRTYVRTQARTYVIRINPSVVGGWLLGCLFIL